MDAKTNAVQITPETKIGALLEQFPELEKFLMEMSPAFGKLRNPIVRKTIGKIATLRQVAEIGGVPLATVINTLRTAAGMETLPMAGEMVEINESSPDWYNPAAIYKTLDGAPILESGQHPLGIVMQDIKEMPDGKIYELITPFIPVPLIDAAKGKGYAAWTRKCGAELFKTYFTKSNR